MSNEEHYISGWNTPNDWAEFRSKLIQKGSEDDWEKAFKEYYKTRLDFRYLDPVDLLQEHGTCLGEGFSIMTILCSLIEFLESTYQGKIYKYVRNENQLGEHEYCSSKSMFVSFLINRKPFSESFDNETASEFYKNIRCGLLHEASTNGGWRIWARSTDGKFVDFQEKKIFRDNFKSAISQFISDYSIELKSNVDLQNAFIRKFDSL